MTKYIELEGVITIDLSSILEQVKKPEDAKTEEKEE